MDFTVDQLFDALGLEKPQEESPAETPEETGTVIDPDGPTTGPGGASAAQQPEENVQQDPAGRDGPGAAEQAEAPADAQQASVQSQEAVRQAVDAALAARDAEHRSALEAMEQRQKQQWAEFFQAAQLQNTITGKPITTREEFDSWKREFDAVRLERELQEGKLSREGLDAAISTNPAVKAAQEYARRQEEAQQSARAAEEASAFQARVAQELAEIGKLDPSVKSVEDLLKRPNAQRFYEYVKRGNTFLDAYYLANREDLARKAAEENARRAQAAQQAALNARSKDHLRTTEAKGGGAESVPSGDMALFKALLPDAKTEDIQTYYNNYRKGV